jgi:hypothetical protein
MPESVKPVLKNQAINRRQTIAVVNVKINWVYQLLTVLQKKWAGRQVSAIQSPSFNHKLVCLIVSPLTMIDSYMKHDKCQASIWLKSSNTDCIARVMNHSVALAWCHYCSAHVSSPAKHETDLAEITEDALMSQYFSNGLMYSVSYCCECDIIFEICFSWVLQFVYQSINQSIYRAPVIGCTNSPQTVEGGALLMACVLSRVKAFNIHGFIGPERPRSTMFPRVDISVYHPQWRAPFS